VSDDPLYEKPSVSGNHHLPTIQRMLYVSPSADGEQFQRIRLGLRVQACWRLNNALFAFDSSLLQPQSAPELRQLMQLLEQNPDCPASVFGHADPVGEDSYNKLLSGRRAKALYSLLIRDVAAWERLYKEPTAGDQWGVRALQMMLGTVQPRTTDSNLDYLSGMKNEPVGYYRGPWDGVVRGEYQQAARAFQQEEGLVADGIVGPKTRNALFLRYMDSICLSPSESFVMKPEQFLGEGKDPEGKGALQGCGEFNPVFLFSQADRQRYTYQDQQERNQRNAVNRRVMVFLFQPNVKISPNDWPCPRWNEGMGGCKGNFWPDGEQWRENGPEERWYRKDRHTMACRWYDRHARLSPCEGCSELTDYQIRLYERNGMPSKEVDYAINVGGKTYEGKTSQQGDILLKKVVSKSKCKIRWTKYWVDPKEHPKPKFDYENEADVYLNCSNFPEEEKGKRELSNIGYSYVSDIKDAMIEFRKERGETDNGIFQEIEEIHEKLLTFRSQISNLSMDTAMTLQPISSNTKRAVALSLPINRMDAMKKAQGNQYPLKIPSFRKDESGTKILPSGLHENKYDQIGKTSMTPYLNPLLNTTKAKEPELARSVMNKIIGPDMIDVNNLTAEQEALFPNYFLYVPPSVVKDSHQLITIIFGASTELFRYGLRHIFQLHSNSNVLFFVSGIEPNTTKTKQNGGIAWGNGIDNEIIKKLFTKIGMSYVTTWEVRNIVAFSTGYRGLNGTVNNFAESPNQLDLTRVRHMVYWDCFYQGNEPKPERTKNAIELMNRVSNYKVNLVLYEVTNGTPRKKNNDLAVPEQYLKALLKKRLVHVNLKQQIIDMDALIFARLFDDGLADGYLSKTALPQSLIHLISSLHPRGFIYSNARTVFAYDKAGKISLGDWGKKNRKDIENFNLSKKKLLWQKYLQDSVHKYLLMGWSVHTYGEQQHDGFAPELGWEFLLL
jgi:hypothetical protein